MRVLLSFILALGLLGCEHGIDLLIKVKVPEAAQSGITPDTPARIMVRGEFEDYSPLKFHKSLGVLCEKQAEEVEVILDFFTFGCVNQGVVTAWLAPIGAEGEKPACEMKEENYFLMNGKIVHGWEVPIGPTDPQDAATVFEGKQGGNGKGCDNGSAELEFVLKAPE